MALKLATKKIEVSTPNSKTSTTGGGKKKKTEHSLTFQDELDKKIAEHKQEVSKLRDKIELLRKDNERIVRRQERTFGASLDDVELMKKDLESTLNTNDRLYLEMEDNKERYNRLKSDLIIVREKVASATVDLSEYKRETKVWKDTSERYVKGEEKCKILTTKNKDLRYLLMKKNINPRTRVLQDDEDTEHKSIAKSPPLPDVAKPSQWRYLKPLKGQTLENSGKHYKNFDEFETIRRRVDIQNRHSIGKVTRSYDGYFERYKQLKSRNTT